jgi:hypothetical protein
MYCVNSILVANLTSYFLYIEGTASTAERSKCWKRTNSHVIIRKKRRSTDIHVDDILYSNEKGWAVLYEVNERLSQRNGDCLLQGEGPRSIFACPPDSVAKVLRCGSC